ncbi:LacI family DNA-binding transcriptional regulator [Streptomyces europaeiscabiei]|uniref:LacI family DNA-binding transcriptional regulator n=1 Tax=Streptomyces europaeiscabiei TaxID=146819 RepID=UPI00386C9AE2
MHRSASHSGGHVGRPSVKDVALRAGVSLGTVSNVLNQTKVVRAETRRRVEAAIAELGFVRNDSARQLRAGVSCTIAYVTLDVGNPLFTDVARGIDDIGRRHGLAVYLCDSRDDPEREDDYIDQFWEQSIRGICLTPVNPDNPRLRLLADSGVSLVMVDRVPREEPIRWCSVGVDDVRGGELAVTHLLERGHRRIAFVAGPMHIPEVADRLRGAQQATQAFGADAKSLTTVGTDDMTVDEGRRAAARVLGQAKATRPTAAFCANDLLALGFLQHVMQQGLRVPDDIAIVGYDDIAFASAAAVPLTSVRQPRHLIGRTAAELLLEESGRNAYHEHRHVQFPPDLVVRQSSGSG